MTFHDLQPQPLWRYFAEFNQVPRASKNEGAAIQFVVDFARKLQLEVSTDATGNVLLRKPASSDRQGGPVVALQSHLDMVHQKNSGTAFDFATQGIAMLIEGDWVRAQGTTLGADNGIGVAAMMAVLASSDLSHPPLEALFTIDEETGMTGAKGLQGGLLRAKYLLNLDTEDDDELTIGCAGGVDVSATGAYAEEEAPAQLVFLQVYLQGLSGGHSGMDIHRGRANANKLMNRLLFEAAERFGLRLGAIDGGGLRNAIPRESKAVVAIAADKMEEFTRYLGVQESLFLAEYRSTDPNLTISSASAPPCRLLSAEFQTRLLRCLYALPHGIYRLSPDVPGLVQTSNNLARVVLGGGRYSVYSLCRGSVDSEKMDFARAIQSALLLLGAEVHCEGEYPGWTPRPDSPVTRLMGEIYQTLFGSPAHIKACHAGLECGILGTHYPEMEMISFGPNIRGAHSPDERVQISSVEKFWSLLKATLAKI